MIGVNNKNLINKIQSNYDKLDYPNRKWVNQQLMHPIIMNLFVLPLYNFLNLGKIILELSIRFKILSKAVSKIEYKGNFLIISQKLPNSLAKLANNQFKN